MCEIPAADDSQWNQCVKNNVKIIFKHFPGDANEIKDYHA